MDTSGIANCCGAAVRRGAEAEYRRLLRIAVLSEREGAGWAPARRMSSPAWIGVTVAGAAAAASAAALPLGEAHCRVARYSSTSATVAAMVGEGTAASVLSS